MRIHLTFRAYPQAKASGARRLMERDNHVCDTAQSHARARVLDRSEFVPFAPEIAAAAEVFDVNSVNAYACRFMTIDPNSRPS